MRDYNKPVPPGHVCLAFVIRADSTGAYTLCQYGHVVMSVKWGNEEKDVEWNEHLRELHERAISRRRTPVAATVTQEETE